MALNSNEQPSTVSKCLEITVPVWEGQSLGDFCGIFVLYVFTG